MKASIKILPIYLLVILLASCSVTRHIDRQIDPDPNNKFVYDHAPEILQGFDDGLIADWNRVQSYCNQKIDFISREITERESDLSSLRTTFGYVGGTAALLNTIYIGTRETNQTPDKKITIPLVAISGGALLTLIPQDKEIAVLNEQLKTSDLARAKCQNTRGILVNKMIQLGIIDAKIDSTSDPVKKDKLLDEETAIRLEAAQLRSQLRTELAEWQTILSK